MPWHLFASPRSPFVRKVVIAAHELGLDDRIERREVTTTPVTPAPELTPTNPVGMIPTLVVDGEMIFDSFVILEFLDEAAGGGLFPKGAARRDCLVRHAMANAMMDKAVRILDERFRDQNRDTEEHREGYIAAIRRGIDWAEPRLTGARFDAGDIAFTALLAYLDMRFPEIDWRDGADAAAMWYARQQTRPSVEATKFAALPA